MSRKSGFWINIDSIRVRKRSDDGKTHTLFQIGPLVVALIIVAVAGPQVVDRLFPVAWDPTGSPAMISKVKQESFVCFFQSDIDSRNTNGWFAIVKVDLPTVLQKSLVAPK